MIREDLKRCPFCGGRAEVWSWNGGARVDCENWNSKGGFEHFVGIGAKTEEEAVRLWQERFEDDND